MITTGKIVAPNSKHPFLNMKTLVLLIHVPGERERERGGRRERERRERDREGGEKERD